MQKAVFSNETVGDIPSAKLAQYHGFIVLVWLKGGVFVACLSMAF